MEYFDQLLESYSKLKKRTLRLIESQNPEALAQQAVQQAQSQNPPPSTSKPFVVNGAKSQVALLFTKKLGNEIGFTTIDSKGYPVISHIKPVSQFYPEFVGYFGTGEEGEQQDASQEKVKLSPGEKMLMDEKFGSMGDEMSLVVDEIRAMAEMCPSLYENLPKKLVDGTNWGTLASMSNYVYGGKKQSLESLLMNIKLKIIQDPNSKEYVTTFAEPDMNVLYDVSKTLRKTLELVTKESLTADDKLFINSFLAQNSDGSVSIFQDTKNSGLVFEDGSGFLKMILASINRKFKAVIPTVNVDKPKGTGLDNVIRGTSLEEVACVFALQKSIIAAKMAGKKGADKIGKATAKIFSNLKNKLQKMADSYQAWVMNYTESAISPEDKEIIDNVGMLIGPKGGNLISAMFKASKEAISLRSPDFIIPVGKETGNGIRHDTLELHSTPEKCMKALQSMGYHEAEIQKLGLMKTGTVEELFKDRKDLYKLALDAGVFQKGQPVYYSPVSLKNYLNLSDAVFGTTTVGSNSSFIQGKGGSPEFFEKARKVSGILPSEVKRVAEYDRGLMDIGDKIRKIPVKSRIITTDGKSVKQNPFEAFADSVLEVLKKTSSYDELYDPESPDSTRNELVTLVKKYKEANKDKDNATLEEKIRQYTNTFVKNKKLAADIEAGDKAAKQYLAMKLMNTGGTADDGLMCDYRGLESGERYNFLQSEVVNEIIDDWTSNRGNWMFQARGNGFYWVNRNNPKMKLILYDKVEQREDTFSTKSSCIVNRDLMLHYTNRRKAMSAREQILVDFLEQQRKLFESILGIKEVEISNIV